MRITVRDITKEEQNARYKKHAKKIGAVIYILMVIAFYAGSYLGGMTKKAFAQNTQGTYKNQNSMSCDSTCLVSGQAVLNYTNTTTANDTYSQVATQPAQQQPKPQQCQGGTQPVFYYGTNTPVYNGVTPVCCPNGYTQQYVGGGQLLYIGNKNACIPIQTN